MSEGNIIISALIKGKLYIEYKAVNENNQTVEFNLSTKLNELIEGLSLMPGFEYFEEKNSSSSYSVIEESGDNLTSFAIEKVSIPSNLHDEDVILEKTNEFCDNDDISVKVKDVNGTCLTSGENIIDLKIESGANDYEFFFWTNKIDVPITNFHYTLTIRNRFDQIINSKNSFVIHNINPGVTLQS